MLRTNGLAWLGSQQNVDGDIFIPFSEAPFGVDLTDLQSIEVQIILGTFGVSSPAATLVLDAPFSIPEPGRSLDAMLSGDQEVPPSGSNATGLSVGSYDGATRRLVLQTLVTPPISMSSLIDGTPFHIHVGAAGINGPVILALGMDTDWTSLPVEIGGGIFYEYVENIDQSAIGTPTGL